MFTVEHLPPQVFRKKLPKQVPLPTPVVLILEEAIVTPEVRPLGKFEISTTSSCHLSVEPVFLPPSVPWLRGTSVSFAAQQPKDQRLGHESALPKT